MATFTCGKTGTLNVEIEMVNGKLVYQINGQTVSATSAGIVARFHKKYGYFPSAEEIKANVKAFSTNALRDFVEVESGKNVRDFFGLEEATPKPRGEGKGTSTKSAASPLASYLTEKERGSLQTLQKYLQGVKEEDQSETATKARSAVAKLVEKARKAQAADAKAKAELAKAQQEAKLENDARSALAALDAELAELAQDQGEEQPEAQGDGQEPVA